MVCHLPFAEAAFINTYTGELVSVAELLTVPPFPQLPLLPSARAVPAFKSPKPVLYTDVHTSFSAMLINVDLFLL